MKRKTYLFILFIIVQLLFGNIISRCGKGTFKNLNGNCETCPSGTYNDSEDSETCKSCPDGTWTKYFSPENRIECKGCGKGSYMNKNKMCYPCDQGTFNDQEIAESCKKCPPGTWNWFYTSENRETCKGCGKGRYLSENKECPDCPNGSYNLQYNATNCTKVPPGFKFVGKAYEPEICEKGYFSPGGSITYCIKCPTDPCETIKLSGEDEKEILRLVELSKYTYDINILEDETDHKLEGMKMITNPNLDTRILIGFDKQLHSIVIAIRGTDNFSNLISDIKFLKDDFISIEGCSNCKIHKGFLESYEGHQKALDLEIKNLFTQFPDKNIIVTGHSYGGAVATLEAVRLQTQGFNVSLITFGSPRVGNSDFANYANKIISGNNFRITYQDDPIISIPPTNMNYQHVGSEIQYYNYQDYYSFPKYFDRRNNLNSLDLSNHSEYWNLIRLRVYTEESEIRAKIKFMEE